MQFTIRSATDLYPRIDEWESAHTITMAMLDNLPLYNMASVGFVLDPPEWPGCWSSVLVFSRSDLGWDASGHMYWLPQDWEKWADQGKFPYTAGPWKWPKLVTVPGHGMEWSIEVTPCKSVESLLDKLHASWVNMQILVEKYLTTAALEEMAYNRSFAKSVN